MHLARAVLALLIPFGMASALHAATDESTEPDDIPAVGRPVDLPFSEASGWFEVGVHAEPTTLEAETPLTFAVTVRATRDVHRPPQRLDLRQLPAFAEQFYIEDPSEEANRPDQRTWEFVYRLKPRRTDVTEVPSFPFVYFNPYLRTVSKGFQVIYTDPIPLQVLPHEAVQVPVQAPDSAFQLATGPGLLDRQAAWTPPAMATILVILLMPPICMRRLLRRLATGVPRRGATGATAAQPRRQAGACDAAGRVPARRGAARRIGWRTSSPAIFSSVLT